MAWAEGVKAFFNGDRETFLPKFRAGLAEIDDVTLRARRLLFLAEHDADNAITYLREAVKAKPESRQAHVALCLALEEAKDLEALQQAVADAIVEADVWTDRRQRPLCFLRELSSQPWWCNAAVPWVQDLERLSPQIRHHLEALMPLLHHASGPQPPWAMVGGEHRLSGSQDGEAVTQGSWHEVVLFGYGHENQDEICRPLMNILRNLLPDAVSLAEAGAGEVILSALAPHTEVAPHCARANHRLTAHLGLLIPTGDPFLCGIRVGEEWRCWQPDKVMIFDDSFEHEVCNRSPSTRVVLLIRFWHPQLQTETQRLGALQRMQVALAQHQQLQVLPPLAPAFQEPSQALEEHFLGDGLCPGCGANEGGDLILDEERKCVRLISRCCVHVLQ